MFRVDVVRGMTPVRRIRMERCNLRCFDERITTPILISFSPFLFGFYASDF